MTSPRKSDPVVTIKLLDVLVCVVLVVILVAGHQLFLDYAYWLAGAVVLGALGYVVFRVIAHHQREQALFAAELKRYQVDTYSFEAGPDGNYNRLYDPERDLLLGPEPGNMIQPVPQALTFAPHYAPSTHYTNKQDIQGQAPPPGLLGPTQVTEIPPLMHWLQQGAIKTEAIELKDKRGLPYKTIGLLAGIADLGDLFTTTWADMRTTLLLGDSSSGKTNTALFWTAQAVLASARLIIIDRHKKDDESLAYQLEPFRPFFLCEPAQTDEEIANAVRIAQERLDRRLEGKEDKHAYPVLLLADEMTSLFARRRKDNAYDQFALTLEAYAEEGRKVFCYALGITHNANDERTASEITHAVSAYGVHRVDKDMARRLVGSQVSSAEKPLIEESMALDTGQLLFKMPGKPLTRMRIPLVTLEDIEVVARLAQARASEAGSSGYAPRLRRGYEAVTPRVVEADSRPDVTTSETTTPPRSLAQMLPDLPPELMEKVDIARQLRRAGSYTDTDMILRLWNLRHKGGDNWHKYASQYERIKEYLIAEDLIVRWYDQQAQTDTPTDTESKEDN